MNIEGKLFNIKNKTWHNIGSIHFDNGKIDSFFIDNVLICDKYQEVEIRALNVIMTDCLEIIYTIDSCEINITTPSNIIPENIEYILFNDSIKI